MDNIAGTRSSLTWAVHISVAILVVLWLFPTVGLFVSSFRTADQISSSGWWKALFPSEQNLVLRSSGPDSLRQYRRTYRNALQRMIAEGSYDPTRPRVIPVKDDYRFRMRKSSPQPDSSAVVFHMMDVSGSMGREQKEVVRIEAFWIDTWLKSQYDRLV